ncbi:DUF305 domain-containing protein [Streptomyces sp. DSM 44915]|uniref:DUF305 domain-containing protein n=1 Tax=Streptomyces chisholmiae TaxID=3075540 RepID=A0ABU2JML2_9ACTN|nr:DUF305 domain-containing protein [Streptomyces sp. DSM 44915]MDT0265948.1 DUF305 domain-containing protein [Streptomyces sp. DSM 44915]
MTDRPRATHRRSPAPVRVALTAALAVLGLAACSGGTEEAAADDPRPSVIAPGAPGEDAETLTQEEAAARLPEAGAADPADLAYLRGMIEHHGQALAMTELALTHAEDPAVRGIAERIEAAQGPEIEVMRAWLAERGADGEDGGQGEHGDHGDHGEPEGHGDMPGMASPEELDRLAAARGDAFDALFLELMIRHHEGGVTMAVEVLGSTTDQSVEQLANDVVASQSAEIDRMTALT